MTFQPLFALISGIFWLMAPVLGTSANPNPETSKSEVDSVCQRPALDRLKSHTVAPGETIESIARQYNLIPATLMGMNPPLRGGLAPVGSAIAVPPYNGIRVEVPAGWTWQKLAEVYKVRADVLFEVNGCLLTPEIVFVPGVNWSPGTSPSPGLSPLQGYPLPTVTQEGLGYGWQLHPVRGQVFFHSGLDLLAPIGTKVLVVGVGTVAFAGTQGAYGNLVVVNHQAGKQTRYAHLGSIAVKVGQKVQQGDVLGTVGATGKPDLVQPHLHFEVRYNSNLGWVAEEPESYLRSASKR
ncbi:peptidase [Oscillatoriales cyanobacterium USR001]|nr:peptidase [Oscillatoriales cyanobacterium USR001]